MSIVWTCEVCGCSEEGGSYAQYEGWSAPGGFSDIMGPFTGNAFAHVLVCSEECADVAYKQLCEKAGVQMCPGSSKEASFDGSFEGRNEYDKYRCPDCNQRRHYKHPDQHVVERAS